MDQADRVLSTPPTNTSPRQPEKPQDALYLKTDATPEEIFQAIGRLRKEARDAIDELIRFIDKTDDYVSRELEDDGDHGDQSFPEGLSRMCEQPLEDAEDAGDDEPSLGSLNDAHGHGARYHAAGSESLTDCELDNSDDEPSLCGIHVECKGGERDLECDLGSPDGIMDQRLTMLASGIPWSVADGEEDGPATG